MLAFGEWLPDLSNFNSGALDVARNVFPQADGYGPLFGPMAVDSAVEAFPGCLNLWFAQLTDGSYVTYGASATAIKKFDQGTFTWTDVSRLVGGAYGVPSDDRWSGVKYGTRLILCQLGDVPQYIDLDTGTNFAALPGSPSTARFVTAMDDKVVFSCLASNPAFVQWSDLNDSEEYTTGLAGNSEFVDHGSVMGFFPHARVVILERGMRSISSTGDIYSFSFPEMATERGTTAPWSCIEIGTWLYYLGDSGFYKVNADVQEPINLSDNRVTNYFFEQVNRDALFQVTSAIDPFNPYIVWTYPTGDEAFNDRALFYHRTLDRWTEGVFDSYCIARLATGGISLEAGTDASSVDAAGLPSFDAKIYAAGAPLLALVDPDGLLCTLTGDTLEAVLEPGIMEFEEDYRSRLTTAGLRARKAGTATLKVATLDTLDDDVTFGAAISMTASGRFPLNHDGAYHQLQFIIPSTAADDPWTHATGWNVKSTPTSER